MKLEKIPQYPRLRVAFEILSIGEGKRILNLGCGGDGLLERYFEDYEVIGLDISMENLRNAKKITPHSEYILADIRNLPIKDECMNKVALLAALGGVSPGEEAITFSEARRILKNGGYLTLLVSISHPVYDLITLDRLASSWKWRHFNPQLLKRQLEENGFKIIKILYTAAILSVIEGLIRLYWGRFFSLFSLFTRRIIGRTFVPPLPYQVMNRIIGVEFRPFGEKMKRFARYIYITAQKT